jgi:hypothetical protein
VSASVPAVRTFLTAALLVLATSGCKDKPKHKAPPANAATPTAKPAEPGAPAPDLELPPMTGGPPKKTTAPHTKADYEKLAKLEFPGFERRVRTVGDKAFEVLQLTNGHPKYGATVTIQHCLDCIPMDLEKWKAKTEDLKVLLGRLKDTPGVLFEVGQTHLNGQPVIFTYQLGQGTTGGDEGGAQTSFTNAYALYYNDGVNQVRVVAEYKDDPRPVEEMKRIAPKEELQMLALSFMNAYTHAW